jgi:hypothetical protein
MSTVIFPQWPHMDEATVRAIANAVERQGGDIDDVDDLIETWERLHAGLAAANVRFAEGDRAGAESVWTQLETEFSKPLDDLVRDRQGRKR